MKNQRTNDPVNAHLTIGPGIATTIIFIATIGLT